MLAVEVNKWAAFCRVEAHLEPNHGEKSKVHFERPARFCKENGPFHGVPSKNAKLGLPILYSIGVALFSFFKKLVLDTNC